MTEKREINPYNIENIVASKVDKKFLKKEKKTVNKKGLRRRRGWIVAKGAHQPKIYTDASAHSRS